MTFNHELLYYLSTDTLVRMLGDLRKAWTGGSKKHHPISAADMHDFTIAVDDAIRERILSVPPEETNGRPN